MPARGASAKVVQSWSPTQLLALDLCGLILVEVHILFNDRWSEFIARNLMCVSLCCGDLADLGVGAFAEVQHVDMSE